MLSKYVLNSPFFNQTRLQKSICNRDIYSQTLWLNPKAGRIIGLEKNEKLLWQKKKYNTLQ